MTPPNPEVPVKARLDSLTGLRFFAAFAVFLAHARGGATEGPLRDVLDAIGAQGSVGVSFFYILSGFVLTWSHSPGDTVHSFYRRRFARIAPAYWVCLVAGVGLAIGISGAFVASVVNAAPSVVGLQAWIPVEDVYYGGNSVGWSLSCEMFFYALFPALVLLMGSRRGRALAAAAGIALALALPLILMPTGNEHGMEYWAVYIFPAQRLAEFIIGMVIAAVMRRGWRSPVPLPVAIVIALVGYLLAGQVPYWAAVSLVTLVPFALLIASAATADLSGEWGVRAPLLTRLGEWSFAFYLTHSIILNVIRAGLDRLAPGLVVELSGVILGLVLSVAAAATLYALVERPWEKRLRGSPPRPEMLEDEAHR